MTRVAAADASRNFGIDAMKGMVDLLSNDQDEGVHEQIRNLRQVLGSR